MVNFGVSFKRNFLWKLFS